MMTKLTVALFAGMLFFGFAVTAAAQTPPPAPSLVSPAAGASLVQPITLAWSSVVDPGGPIASYTWQVSTTSTFASIIAAGATNQAADTIPAPTHDKLSGLPNGTYFWRVKATAIVALDSAWSVGSFTVVGLGAAPGPPSFTSPSSPAQFHVLEFFLINWTNVPGAHHYLLEADDEPTFSYPLTLTTNPLQFGTTFVAGWGNPLNAFYRIVAVSADGVRSLPSSTLSVQITNTAPVPPPPVPLFPIGGASVSLPFTFDWTDTVNPQVAGYDLDIDNNPNFPGVVGVLLVQGVTRSDYMLVPDPLKEGINHFPPGTYFWRVRAVHGDVPGQWSAGQSFTVLASPATPPGLEIFHIITEPASVSGGNSTQARVTLNMPAPVGGALINIADDFPHAQVPISVVVPEGKTDATVTAITTIPVGGATIGTVRAAYGMSWEQNSLGLFPILWGIALDHDSVAGGGSVVGTATLLNPAPLGGVTVTLVNNNTDLITLPPSVFIPAGGTGVTFGVTTAPVSIPTRVVINAGDGLEGYRSPDAWLTLLPAGSPPAAPSLSSLTLTSVKILGESSTTGTVTLTSAAPAGGALVWLSGSMEGQVVTPPNVTVPAGGISANFTITAPQVNAPRYVLIQGAYGPTGGNQAKLLEIDPGPPGAPTVRALGLPLSVNQFGVIGGVSTRGTVSLVMLAPPAGGAVTLTSDNPSVVQVPPTVSIPGGNSANSFPITTSPVAVGTTVSINAIAGGVTKTAFINVAPNPNAALALLSVTLSVGGVTGGQQSVPGTLFLNANAPAGGASVTLATSNLSAAQVPPVVVVPAGLGFASFTVTTSPVSADTAVTITGFLGASTQSAPLTVLAAAPPPPPPTTPGTPSLLSPANGASPAQPVTLTWTAASNAASYEIQVDDSSTFTVPLVRSLTSTVTQTTVTGLATVRHFWRVRALNSAGVAGNWSTSRRFTPQAAPAAASLSAVSVSPTSVVGGNSSQGTVTLTAAAPTGTVVSLSSANATVAAAPASVTVAAGATSATFTITTTAVTASTPVTISATFAGVTRTAVLTVNPPPAASSLSLLTVNPTSVTGGSASTGTVTLTAAPASAAVVTLSSSNATVASVPASVTVAAGALTANFSIATTAVATATSVTITGAFGGASRTATLSVNPPAPPAQSATLTVTATGRSGERVTSSPAGINVAVGSTGSATFAIGASITLSATNTRAVIWSGACSSGGNKTTTCTFTLTGNASVTANVQ